MEAKVGQFVIKSLQGVWEKLLDHVYVKLWNRIEVNEVLGFVDFHTSGKAEKIYDFGIDFGFRDGAIPERGRSSTNIVI